MIHHYQNDKVKPALCETTPIQLLSTFIKLHLVFTFKNPKFKR